MGCAQISKNTCLCSGSGCCHIWLPKLEFDCEKWSSVVPSFFQKQFWINTRDIFFYVFPASGISGLGSENRNVGLVIRDVSNNRSCQQIPAFLLLLLFVFLLNLPIGKVTAILFEKYCPSLKFEEKSDIGIWGTLEGPILSHWIRIWFLVRLDGQEAKSYSIFEGGRRRK